MFFAYTDLNPSSATYCPVPLRALLSLWWWEVCSLKSTLCSGVETRFGVGGGARGSGGGCCVQGKNPGDFFR